MERAMPQMPKIANAEMEVMKVLWAESPITASRIVELLAKTKPWDPKTVKTLINRLHNKGAVGFEKEGRRYLYFPLVSEAECLKFETQSFVAKFRRGLLKPLLTNFLEEEKLSDEEISELRHLLDKKARE
jgi:BlaI family penicillinase repressor